jgi:hypothetical protein
LWESILIRISSMRRPAGEKDKGIGTYIACLSLSLAITGAAPASSALAPGYKERILKLNEMLRIMGDGDRSVFRAPYGLWVGPDGNAFFYDGYKLFAFSASGERLFAIIEAGQGPGEAIGETSYLVTENEILIQAVSPPKIMKYDLSGKYKSEYRLDRFRLFAFIGMVGDSIYGFRDEPAISGNRTDRYMDLPCNLYEISRDFGSFEKVFSFPIRHFVIKNYAFWPRARLDFAWDGHRFVFVTHTSDYRVVKFDLVPRSVAGILERKYKKVKIEGEPEKGKPGILSPPPNEFYQDIVKLLIHGDRLWVLTSTKDAQNRRLVDEYTMDLKYLGCFYLEYPLDWKPRPFAYGSMRLHGDLVYSLDENSAGDMSFAIYKMTDVK